MDEINLNRANLNPNINNFNSLPKDKKQTFADEWINRNKQENKKGHNYFIILIGVLSLAVIAGLLGYIYYKDELAVCAPNITVEPPVIPKCPDIPACLCPACPSLTCGNVTINSTAPNINVSVFPNISIYTNSS